jgi:hypothetical protein
VWRPATAAIAAAACLFVVDHSLVPAVRVEAALVMDMVIYGALYALFWIGLPDGRRAARDVIDIAKQVRAAPTK